MKLSVSHLVVAGLAFVPCGDLAERTAAADPPSSLASVPPPYSSVRDLPPHPTRAWEILVGDYKHVYRVAETRAASVPLPTFLPWKCRLDHVASYPSGTRTFRTLTCSSDAWRTTVSVIADNDDGTQMVLREGPGVGGRSVEVTLMPRTASTAEELP